MNHRRQLSYWQKNLFYIRMLLFLWSVLALGGGVLWVQPLNRFHIGALPLGFWIAQQGAVIGFVCVVFAYAIGMAHLDDKHTQNIHKPPSDCN